MILVSISIISVSGNSNMTIELQLNYTVWRHIQNGGQNVQNLAISVYIWFSLVDFHDLGVYFYYIGVGELEYDNRITIKLHSVTSYSKWRPKYTKSWLNFYILIIEMSGPRYKRIKFATEIYFGLLIKNWCRPTFILAIWPIYDVIFKMAASIPKRSSVYILFGMVDFYDLGVHSIYFGVGDSENGHRLLFKLPGVTLYSKWRPKYTQNLVKYGHFDDRNV